MSKIARTVEDVRRMAPTAGWYWVNLSTKRWIVIRLAIQADGMRGWFTAGKATGFGDDKIAGLPIIGPLTPPSEEDTHG